MKELVDEVQRRKRLGDQPPFFPNGWFALLDSSDLKAGQVKHVQALGDKEGWSQSFLYIVRKLWWAEVNTERAICWNILMLLSACQLHICIP